ncbi:MAG: hypothetical protein NTX22_01275 [Ignavibacteriales bacterium]|nr:hypothetical protein [Ignavibacteriales bacterium]
MNHINDEILNRYFDNDLTMPEITLVTEHIKDCAECLAKLKAQKLADINLKRLDTFQTSFNFAEKVMQKISLSAFKFKPKKSYFFRVVFSTFILASLAVVVFAFASLPMNASESSSDKWIEYINNILTNAFSAYKNTFGKINISLIGTILTFVLFISGYFVFESHRKIKNQIEKLR